MNFLVPPVSVAGQLKSFLNADCSVVRKKRVMLLQGPVGPFFLRLHNFLEAQNVDVVRVSFHAGDRFYSKRAGLMPFSGAPEEWKAWIEAQLSTGKIDCIIMFGSERFLHKVARAVAIEHQVRVVALEEGYIRPGYISIEEGGNNAFSPLAGKLPIPDYIAPTPTDCVAFRDGFRRMCVYGAVYFTSRGILSLGRRRRLFHRNIQLLPETFFWGRNVMRRFVSARRDSGAIQKLATGWDRQYFLIPLQVSNDSNIKYSGQGWTSKRLISESILSFSKAAPSGSKIVFKIHPMERGHNNLNSHIRSEATKCGVSQRVDIIETGPLGFLAKHCRGMITINSTSGLSAIFHGTPLLVLGDAIYANTKLAVCAKNGDADFDAFWHSNHVADAKLRQSYLSWIKGLALKPGDFYSKEGSKIACGSVLQKLREIGLL